MTDSEAPAPSQEEVLIDLLEKRQASRAAASAAAATSVIPSARPAPDSLVRKVLSLRR